MEEKLVEFNIDGIVLRGKVMMPDIKKDKYPLLIVMHGLKGNMDEEHILEVSKTASDLGYMTLRYDQYGHGTSDGLFKNHNVLIWMNNAMRIIEEVSKWDEVKDIVLCGHSQGGLNVVMVGAMALDKVKAIIPMSPAINIPDAARMKLKVFGIDLNAEPVIEKATFGPYELSSSYLRSAKMLDVDYAVKEFNKPVLLIHGTKDESVPYSYALKLKDSYANSKLVTINDADHGYHSHLHEVLPEIKKFLEELTLA